MQRIISTERLPVKLWLDEPEDGAVKTNVAVDSPVRKAAVNTLDLEEALSAYKDIAKVMARQGGLVNILVELSRL
jgi:hypothetical protein